MQIHSSAKYGDTATIARLLNRGIPVDLRNKQIGFTPLMAAAASKHAGVDMLELLVSRGADVNGVGGHVQKLPLGLAAKSGDVAKTQYLLDLGASVRNRTAGGYTALIDAVYSYAPNTAVLKMLLYAGVKVNAITHYGEFALGVAVGFGNFEIARMLLDAGADPAPLNWTALMHAIAFGSVEDVSTELGKNPDLISIDSRNLSAWQLSLSVGDVRKSQLLLEHAPLGDSSDLFAAVRRDNPEMVTWLIDLGADVNARDHFEHSALMQAAERGCTECVRILLDKGADVHATNHVSHTALSRAANPEIARLLMQAGADLDYVDGEGYTLLKHAAELGDEELVKGLLEMGASTEAGDHSGSPLYVAVRADELHIARMLLAAGANPNAQTIADWWFPLQNAQSVEMVRALLDAGADINLTDDGRGDALQDQDDPIVAEFMIKSGAKVNPDHTTVTPLIRAVEKYSLELMRLFIQSGADVNATTSWGKTALMEACENSYIEGVRLLLDAKADINLTDEDGRTTVFYAAAPEGFTAYELMMKYGGNRASRNRENKRLKALGIEFDYSSTYGYVESDSIEALELLVKAGADINARASNTMTSLMLAASCGRPARVKGLLALGANRELQDKDGKTARNYAENHPIDDHRREIIHLLSM